jgi:hypothetical protein
MRGRIAYRLYKRKSAVWAGSSSGGLDTGRAPLPARNKSHQEEDRSEHQVKYMVAILPLIVSFVSMEARFTLKTPFPRDCVWIFFYPLPVDTKTAF